MMTEKTVHILIVLRDERERSWISTLLTRGLKGMRCSIDTAETVRQATEKIGQTAYDICLLDSNLPDREALWFLHEVHVQGISLPVLVLCENSDEETATLALEAGAKSHLMKSTLSPDLLTATVRHVLLVDHHEKLRQQAQWEARRVQKRNQHLLASISSILIGVRSDGVVTHWNKVAEKNFGIPAEEAVGRRLSECPVGWDFQTVEKAIGACLAKNEAMTLDDLPFTGVSGEEGLLGFSINPLEGSKHDLAEVLLLGANITDKRKATENLKAYTRELEAANAQIKKEKAKDEAILAGIGEGLVVTDEEGRIILVNRQALLMFRWPGRSVIGEKLISVIGLQDDRGQKIPEAQHPVQAALKTGHKAGAMASHVFPDKSELPLQITASPVVLDGQITGAIGIFRDMTREKEIDRTKTEFISTVSHELRTPLTSIREGVAQVHEGILGPVNDDQKEFLNIALEEVDRLAAIINDLLDISKIEAGKVVLRKSWVDLREVVEQVVFGYQSLVKNKQIELKSILPDGMIEVFCDPDKVKQVVTNLLTNAYKFTDEGGRITVQVEVHEEVVRVTVEDNGIGISEENRAKIFEKFVQVGRTAGPGIKGTGLGLAISKNIVEIHQGKIWVESKVRQGSRFIFTLPKLDKDTAAKENIEYGLGGLASGSDRLSILLMKLYQAKNIVPKAVVKPQQVLKKFLQKARIYHLEGDHDIFLNGSDEALVILPGISKDKALEFSEVLKKALLEMIKEDKSMQGAPFMVHVGISTYPEDAETSETLISKARVSVKPAVSGGGSERRISLRTYYRSPLKLKAGKGQAWEAFSVDLSEGGMKIFGPQGLGVGTVTEVILKLPRDFGVVTPKAMVVWQKEYEKDKRYEMGLQFVGISETLKNKLRRFIESESSRASAEDEAGGSEQRKIA